MRDDRPEWDFITLCFVGFIGFCILILLIANMPTPGRLMPLLAMEVV